MKQRVITGVILAAIIIPFLLLPKAFFFGLMALFVGIGVIEMFAVTTRNKAIPKPVFVYPIAMALSVYTLLLNAWLGIINIRILVIVIFIAMLVGLMLTVFVNRFTSAVLAQSWFSVLYVAVGFFAVAAVRNEGLTTLLYLLLLVMMTDNFAYMVGMKLGRRKLAPTISPKKSIEGAIAGTLIAVPIATIFAYYFNVYPFTTIWVFVVIAIPIGIVLSILGQIGDLIASRIKRDYSVKDFSNLLPGHGGILDRFDSTAFTSIALFTVLMIIEVL